MRQRLALALVLAAATGAAALQAQETAHTLRHGARDRTYPRHVPAGPTD